MNINISSSHKLSDYISNNNWYSFIKNGIIDCPSDSYPTLLNRYFEQSNQYNLFFKISDALLVIDLLGEKNATKKYKNDSNIDGHDITLTTRIVDVASPKYIWPNGFIFIQQLFERFPILQSEFINHNHMINSTHNIILNHQIYINDNFKELKEFTVLFSHLLEIMNKKQFDLFYQHNNLHIQKNSHPSLRVLLNKSYLEKKLSHNECKYSNIVNQKI